MSTHAPPVQLAALKSVTPKTAVAVILGVSLAALALLVVVIYGHGPAAGVPAWVSYLPALNAFLNGTSAVFLVLAYAAIRRRAIAAHARHMLTAMASSTLFLVSYIAYHSVHGDTKFLGQGAIRPVYFFILISHIGLSAVVLPLIFSSFFFSLSGRFPAHKKVSRYTLPVWLYVSVTGVLVFALLRAYG
jgi:putative membrane protein